MAYNWQQEDWPHFTFDLTQTADALQLLEKKTGYVNGILAALPNDIKIDAVIDLMVAEAIKTSEIEGEFLSRKDVASSIRKNLGLLNYTTTFNDKRVDGIAELMVDVRNSYKEELTPETLFAWHKMLFKNDNSLSTGAWRLHEEPMQVVSGAMGKEKVHFEAPPSARIPDEMNGFINWFNHTAPGSSGEQINTAARAAIAHLYFESIHPFEDGNGRIGRAIAEKALSQGMRRPAMLSLSNAIELDKKAYYTALEKAQRSMEITHWLAYFIQVIIDAQDAAEAQIQFTLKKARFFDKHKNQLNDRQLVAIKRMLEEGPGGFEGGMNAQKYIGITKTSKATATRDLQDLLEMGAFEVLGAGRSTRYQLTL